ncbi:hypothetical protein [Nitrosomonas oligotropha]|uniref:hypothetical protein n=1 Tax=Nitrosomonas oligotropha TaxID=42354 RepID=UPI0019603C99|nr:hypothetical protein [Nitrosomonas oligotropha]
MALAADRNTQMKDGELLSVPLAAVKVFAGAIVAANSSGYATKGQAAVGMTYLGRAEEQVDNSGGSAGDKKILVRRGKDFKWKNSATSAITQADFGKICYIEDDETVSKTDQAGTLSAAGTIVGVESDGVWVAEVGKARLTATATLDFGSINAAASADLTITVAGAAVNDSVSLGLPAAPTAGIMFRGFVSAANTVTVRATNITGSPVDPASATYRATVIKT